MTDRPLLLPPHAAKSGALKHAPMRMLVEVRTV
jgi:hypothetical protein